MATLTQLPIMTGDDARAVGFAQFNSVPHLPIDVPDGGFTITARTSDGRRLTLYFGPYRTGGPPRFVDVQYHDRGSTVPDGRGGQAPTFNSFAIAQGGRDVADTRPLPEHEKPSIMVILLENLDEESVSARAAA